MIDVGAVIYHFECRFDNVEDARETVLIRLLYHWMFQQSLSLTHLELHPINTRRDDKIMFIKGTSHGFWVSRDSRNDFMSNADEDINHSWNSESKCKQWQVNLAHS